MKTFCSARYGFQIAIPNHWSCPPTGFLTRLFGLDKNPRFASGDATLNFQMNLLPSEPPLGETENAFREYARQVGHCELRTSVMTVAGADHFCAVYRAKDGTWLKKYILVFHGVEYAVTCRLGRDECAVAEMEEEYDAVVASFQLDARQARSAGRASEATGAAKRRALQLNQAAFNYVQVGDYQKAVPLLEQAVRLAPDSADCHNELSICYDRLGRSESAEREVRAAISCDPNNPKFRNGLVGVLFSRVVRARSQQQLVDRLAEVHREIGHVMDIAPQYAPAHFAKAQALALSGAAQELWEAELAQASKKYKQSGSTASGLPADDWHIECIVEENRVRCREMHRLWESLSLG